MLALALLVGPALAADMDHDGQTVAGGDCNDADAAVYTGAPELCDDRPNDCALTGWTPARELGTASLVVGGTWSDVTAAFASGTPTTPYAYTSTAAAESVYLCARTWHIQLSVDADNQLDVYGRGPGSVVDGAHNFRPFAVDDAVLGLHDLTLRNGYSATDGGAIVATSMSDATDGVSLTDMVVESNESGGNGGALAMDGGDLSLTSVLFQYNTATAHGGSAYWVGDSISGFELAVAHTTFADSTADGGGGMYAAGMQATLTDVVFTENTATFGGGLAMYVFADTVAGRTWQLTDVTFVDNAADFGGGVYVNGSDAGTEIDLTRVDCTGNSATSWGGGIYWFGGPTSVVHTADVVLADNDVVGNGGGAYIAASTATWSDLEVSGNTASGNGGGLDVDPGTGFTLDASTLEDNVAGSRGGGMAVSGDKALTITDTVFTGNSARYGGGLEVIGYGTLSAPIPLTLDGVTLTSNDAQSAGGGGWFLLKDNLAASDLLVADNRVTGTTGGTGAGLYVESTALSLASSTIRHNTFVATIGTRQGGGLFLKNSPTTTTTTTISSNTAGSGGGIYKVGTGSGLDLGLSTLVTLNTAAFGGGLYVASGESTCVGSTSTVTGFRKNKATGAGNGGGVQLSGSSSGTTFDATDCDFGGVFDPANNNTNSATSTPADVSAASTIYNYLNDAEASCDAASGC